MVSTLISHKEWEGGMRKHFKTKIQGGFAGEIWDIHTKSWDGSKTTNFDPMFEMFKY